MATYPPLVGAAVAALVLFVIRFRTHLLRAPIDRRKWILLTGEIGIAVVVSIVLALISVQYPGITLSSGPAIAAIALLFFGLIGALYLAVISLRPQLPDPRTDGKSRGGA